VGRFPYLTMTKTTPHPPNSEPMPTSEPSPIPSADTRARSPYVPFACGSLLFVAATVLPLFRQTGSRSWQTIWAEDGFEYFQQAHGYGGLSVLLRGYGGYLQLPPRLLAVMSTSIPIHDLSIYMALSGTFVGALLAWFTYHVSEGWIASPPVRLALASLVVLMPALGAEDTANITNLIWVFAAVAPWALVSLDEHARDIVMRSLVAFLAATSTSLCFLFLPLALGFVLVRRTRAAGIVAAAFIAGLTVQVAVVLHTKDIVSFIPQSFLNVQRTMTGITEATGVHVFATFFIGSKGTNWHWLTQHHLLALGSIVLFAVIFGLLLRGAERKRKLLAAVFAAYAVISFVAPVWSRRDTAPRYSVIPVLLLASAVAVLIADPTRRGNQWIARVGRPLFVAQVLVVAAIGFSVTTYRSESPQWSNSVTLAGKTKCQGVDPNKVVEVRTDQFNAWPVALPCRDVSP
jgi:hypothetical protein